MYVQGENIFLFQNDLHIKETWIDHMCIHLTAITEF